MLIYIKGIDKDKIAKEKAAEGKKQADKLDDAMKDLVAEREKKLDAKEEAAADMKVTGFKYVDLVLKYGKTAGASVDMLNQYLIESPDMLEKADTYIDKYMGGFLSTKKMGEWYETGKEWGLKSVSFGLIMSGTSNYTSTTKYTERRGIRSKKFLI